MATNRVKKRDSKFTQVSNVFLRDDNISFKAKGLFCYMFSMSDDWNFTIKSIANQQKDGEACIISALKELKDAGYIQYTKHNDGSGTYFLDDEPKLENPNVENPNLGKSTCIKNTQLTKNKNNLDDAEEIYTHYKENIKSSKSKQSAINNILRWLKEYKKEIMIQSIDNYKKSIVGQDTKYIKDCKNFFGVKDESKGYFIDFIDYESDEVTHRPKLDDKLGGYRI